ncbi:MAG: IS1182 family transposase [Verrucomicrobiae bacterium]|nr:IS1182 family transposase [Verrucomicrobiae bacterium]NNJ87126.1 IS1182 family transposase [Akkermansiaceae bacterium]
MKRFVEGVDREQSTLFPERLDDYIGEDNPVRVVDVFVDELDLGVLGFDRVEPRATGRPGYHPSVLLKLYVYGYLNRVQSSRRLEREACRNVEVMWLTGRLAPDHKTIADFRKDNGRAIRNVCSRFVGLCRQLNLFADASVAIDGSKFKAVNGRDRNFTRNKMKRRMEQVEESVERYLHQLDSADRQEPSLARETSTVRLNDKIARLKEEMQRLKKLEARMLQAPDQQISLTDPDARSMATSGRGSGMVGYNVQAAVDIKHHLIVTHKVTNQGTDRVQLSTMAKQTKAAVETESLDVVADRGYFSSEEILACDEAGILVTLPKPLTSGVNAKGRFGKQDFVYMASEDVYICPAGERLAYHYTNEEKGLTLHRYWTNACQTCAIKHQCTTGKERRIRRWEHEHVVEAVQQRLDEHPEKMRQRRETVEHPFGTIKSWMGSTHFQMKTLKRVSTEMALHVLAYNLKRVMNILGIGPLMAAMRA